jgi:hypothetical protein
MVHTPAQPAKIDHGLTVLVGPLTAARRSDRPTKNHS